MSRLAGGADDGVDVLDLPLDGVRLGVARRPAAAAVVVEDREPRCKLIGEAGIRRAVDGAAADEDDGWAGKKSVVLDIEVLLASCRGVVAGMG